jgi:hypothetical protein
MRPPQSSVRPIYLQLAPADIALVKFLFESYEEVGLVRTIDRQKAVIVVLVMPDFEPVARAILADLAGRIDCVEIAAPAAQPDDWLMAEIDEEEGG